MAFGQASGPPASGRQLDTLTRLLEEADLGTFREARHRLGLTQRQANGKFTVGEADELIAQLTEVAEEGGAAGSAESVVAATRADDRLARQRDEILAGMPADALADELTRRGWLCMPPP